MLEIWQWLTYLASRPYPPGSFTEAEWLELLEESDARLQQKIFSPNNQPESVGDLSGIPECPRKGKGIGQRGAGVEHLLAPSGGTGAGSPAGAARLIEVGRDRSRAGHGQRSAY